MRGSTNYQKICELPQNSRHQKCDMQPVPCGALTDIRRHRTSFSRLGDLAPGVSIPLVLCNLLIRLVEFPPPPPPPREEGFSYFFLSFRKTPEETIVFL